LLKEQSGSAGIYHTCWTTSNDKYLLDQPQLPPTFSWSDMSYLVGG
jgi:hypothetical protein